MLMSCVDFGSAIASRCEFNWIQSRSWHVAATVAVLSLGSAYHLHRFWRSRVCLSRNHVVVVTGCDSGLGYSLALHCRELGAHVFAGVLREDSPGAKDLQRKDVHVTELDVTDASSITLFVEMLEALLEHHPEYKLFALVNNAGVMVFGEFEWQSAEQARAQLEVNLLGTMAITRALMPRLRQHTSRIVNVSSHCSRLPLPGLAIYSASKAGLVAWSTGLRREVTKYGLSVVEFMPGSFVLESNIMGRQTKYFDDMWAGMKADTQAFYGNYFKRYVSYLTPLSHSKGLKRIENPKLYKAFDGALLDKNPSLLYKCEPWRYTFYETLIRITPAGLSEWLVHKFVRLPAWSCDDPSTVPPLTNGNAADTSANE